MRKTLSFACLHFAVAFVVGWALSGDWRIGGALALVEPLCNTVVFYFHEKFWQRRQAPRAAHTHGPARARHQGHFGHAPRQDGSYATGRFQWLAPSTQT